MELPDDAPKLPKLPFIIADVIFLGVAATLLNRLGDTPSTASIVAIIACAGIGALLLIAPFVINYDRRKDQQLTERQNALESLTRTTSNASEQASIAANGLHEIAEITKRNLHSLEELPAQIEAARQSAKSKENHQHATAVEALRGDMEQVREEQASAQESTTQLLEKLAEQLSDLNAQLTGRISDLEAQLAAKTFEAPAAAPTLKSAPKTKPESEPKPAEPEHIPEPEPESDTESAPVAEEEPSVDESAETASAAVAEEPPPPPPEPKKTSPKPKAAKKPRPPAPPPEPSLFDEPADESTPEEQPEPDPASEPDSAAEPTTEPEPEPEPEPTPSYDDEPPAEPSLSSDGQTRLTVTAYIGIGNRLFVRGDGPGLSREEGTPLQFVSIGKWRWETDAATEPVKLTIWKNDQTECSALGEIELTPGAQLETSANF